MKKKRNQPPEIKVGGKEFQKKFDQLCKEKKKEKKRLKKKEKVPVFIKFGFWFLIILLIVQICFYAMKYFLMFI